MIFNPFYRPLYILVPLLSVATTTSTFTRCTRWLRLAWIIFLYKSKKLGQRESMGIHQMHIWPKILQKWGVFAILLIDSHLRLLCIDGEPSCKKNQAPQKKTVHRNFRPKPSDNESEAFGRSVRSLRTFFNRTDWKITRLEILLRSLFLSLNEPEKFTSRPVIMLKCCTFSAKCANFLVSEVWMRPW